MLLNGSVAWQQHLPKWGGFVLLPLCESGSYLVIVRERELLICWVSGSFSTQLEVQQGKHQRISKSDSLIVRLPKFRCIFELFEVSLLPCNPNRSLPILPLFSWPAFTSLPKSKLFTWIFKKNFFFPQQDSPYPISSKQLTKLPIICLPSTRNLLSLYQSVFFTLPDLYPDVFYLIHLRKHLPCQRNSGAQSWGHLT